jgi:hypothetical protein
VTVELSARRRRDIVDALRRGVVPSNGLDALAVGLDRFTAALNDDLDRVAGGGSVFKAVRGEYGAGKTFFTRWLAERAKRRGFAAAEVQISELETPLHRMETVYRRLVEHLSTEQFSPSAFRPVLDGWIFALEEDVLAGGAIAEDDAEGLDRAVSDLLERHRLNQHPRTGHRRRRPGPGDPDRQPRHGGLLSAAARPHRAAAGEQS